MIKVLFSAKPEVWEDYRDLLTQAFVDAGVDADMARDHKPEDVDYIVFAPNGPVKDFAPYTKTRGVLSLWAGVETVVNNETLTQPLARMVDDSLTQGMVEWVVGHTLRHHLGFDVHLDGQDGKWRDTVFPPLATERPVTILGLGALGAACGQALGAIGFPVTGWSRSQKDVSGLTCLSGSTGFRQAMANAEILVLLLPLTEQTENILNNQTLALLPKGAIVLNPGRGGLINDDALLDALDTGQIGHATLDTFRTEPLPLDHPFWNDPKVTVTPHIASTTRPKTAARIIVENIKGDMNGAGLMNLVDRTAGY